MIQDIRKSDIKVNSSIDPGFINYRKCFSCFGGLFIEGYNKFSSKGDGHLDKLANDHLMVDLALKFCNLKKVKTLGEVLNNLNNGDLFASTDDVGCQ